MTSERLIPASSLMKLAAHYYQIAEREPLPENKAWAQRVARELEAISESFVVIPVPPDEALQLLKSITAPDTQPAQALTKTVASYLPDPCPITVLGLTEYGAVFTNTLGMTIHLSRTVGKGEIDHLFAGHHDYLEAHFGRGDSNGYLADHARAALVNAAFVVGKYVDPEEEGTF